MNKMKLPLLILSATLLLASCGNGDDTLSSSLSEGTSSSLGEGSSSSSSSESDPPAKEGWTEAQLSFQESYLGDGYSIPWMDFGKDGEFQPYEMVGALGYVVEDLPYGVLLDYADLLAEKGFVEDENYPDLQLGELCYFDYQEGKEWRYDLYMVTSAGSFTSIQGDLHIDVYPTVYDPEWPSAEIAMAMNANGMGEVAVPDCSSLPSQNYVFRSVGGIVQVSWEGPEDIADVDALEKIFTDADWTYDPLQNGYLDPTGTALCYIGIEESFGNLFLQIGSPLPTEIPQDQLDIYFTVMLQIDPVDIPEYPGKATYDYRLMDSDYGIYGLVVRAEGPLTNWIEDLETKGWDTSLASEGIYSAISGNLEMILAEQDGVILVLFQYHFVWPTDEIAEAMEDIGFSGVSFPDLTSAGIAEMVVFNDQASNPGLVQLQILSSDYGYIGTQIGAILEENGWTLDEAQGGYVDPSGKVLAVVGAVQDASGIVVNIVNILRAGVVSAAFPKDELLSAIEEHYGSLIAPDAEALDVPAPSFSGVESYYLGYDETGPYLRMEGVTEEEVSSYVATLEEAGWEDMGLASVLGYTAAYANEGMDVAFFLAYDAKTGTLVFSFDALSANYLWDSEYVALCLEALGISEVASLPEIEGYVLTLPIPSYGMLSFMVAGDIKESYESALEADGWTYDAPSGFYLKGDARVGVVYEESTGLSTIIVTPAV